MTKPGCECWVKVPYLNEWAPLNRAAHDDQGMTINRWNATGNCPICGKPAIQESEGDDV